MDNLLMGLAIGIITSLGLMFLNLCISISNHLKLRRIMSKQDQLNATIQELDDATNAIAAKLQSAIDAEKDNVSEESLATLQSVADQLKALGADESNPIPSTDGGSDSGSDAGGDAAGGDQGNV